MVSNEALEVTDGDRLVTHLQMDTLCFALFLLRADATANRRQRTRLMDDIRSLVDITELYLLDESRYIDVHGTTFDAARVLAREATMALGKCLLGRKTEVHLFVQTLNALLGSELGHLDAWNQCSLLRSERIDDFIYDLPIYDLFIYFVIGRLSHLTFVFK